MPDGREPDEAGVIIFADGEEFTISPWPRGKDYPSSDDDPVPLFFV